MARTAFLVTSALAVAALGLQVPAAHGKHSWNKYHWYRDSNPIALELGDNLTGQWRDETFLGDASRDWSMSKVLNTSIHTPTSPLDPQRCGPTDGRVEVCNASYGANGWLGLAQIWVSGQHITKGVAKLNDTYLGSGTYGTPLWRDYVMCQEVGHTFGLGHQDENFNNDDLVSGDPPLETCMDYTNNPEGNGQPNEHDYEQLETIYSHLDGSGSVKGPGNGKGGGNGRGKGSSPGKLVSVSGFQFATYVRDDPSEWGTAVAFTSKGQPRVFVKDLENGVKVITHVTWTEDARAGAHFPHQH